MKNKIAILIVTLIVLCAFCGCATTPDKPPEDNVNYVDVIVFMGQSNMGGRGNSDTTWLEDYQRIVGKPFEAVTCQEGHGYEFRAVTDPTRLYPLSEPFGVNENNAGINDGTKKTGDLVASFVESYFQQTGVPVVAVSASQGGTSIDKWKAGSGYGMVEEAAKRLDDCLNYMYSQDEFTVRHIEMVWLQGESDSTHDGLTYEDYSTKFQTVLDAMKVKGVEHCFCIEIGGAIDNAANGGLSRNERHKAFQLIQQRLCQANADVTLVSIKLAGMSVAPSDGYMHVDVHFTQWAYDIVGADAGRNAAKYIVTGVEQTCKPHNPSTDIFPYAD